ncbi:MAG TPA: formate/nitrite transporter family protein [Rhizomicrobium sp.]|jgi:formate/nitrite transporter FocA (FNT family)|nr:formate/nitrite transporter family protein [Rhizomicrobium sp.]
MAQGSGRRKGGGTSGHHKEEAEEHARLPTRTVYEVVRREGQEEMERPSVSLWWSGFAAGLSISFSLLAQAILSQALPTTTWTPLITGFGYCVGFIMVILARQQLFTESTITVILPLLAEFTRRNVFLSLRMWAIVLVANVAGTLFAAVFCSFTPVLTPDIRHAMLVIAGHAMAFNWWQMLFRGISAGFLMAVMVWLIPSAENTKFHVVILITYLIAIGGFSHIVAGSMESFMLVSAGSLSISQMLLGFFVPVLVGNIIGGTVLFGVLSYAQVMKEI